MGLVRKSITSWCWWWYLSIIVVPLSYITIIVDDDDDDNWSSFFHTYFPIKWPWKNGGIRDKRILSVWECGIINLKFWSTEPSPELWPNTFSLDGVRSIFHGTYVVSNPWQQSMSTTKNTVTAAWFLKNGFWELKLVEVHQNMWNRMKLKSPHGWRCVFPKKLNLPHLTRLQSGQLFRAVLRLFSPRVALAT